tara:strand:+ start:435 stop:1421 length:987 start_codon:yes stop_codon:yes gene_type:complete
MAIKTVDLKIYVYEGIEGSYASTDLRYEIQKEILTGDTNVVFEIAELVRDYLTVDFNNDYLSKSIWATTIATILDENDIVYTYGSPVSDNYLAVNGYGYFEDEINPELSRNALMTSNTIYLPEAIAGKFPIFAEGVGKVTIDSVDTQITDSGNTNQKIQYITIPADSQTIQVYDTDDTTLLKTIKVNNVCEPKYTPLKVTFINKYGAFQDLYFFKKSTESFQVTDETFKRNTIENSTVTYPKYGGQEERYNTNARKNISLNTGFINEDSNSAIEELFLSENVWIRQDNSTLPIVPKSKSLTLKTSLNDKLANYTVDFEFAFNKINNVR